MRVGPSPDVAVPALLQTATPTSTPADGTVGDPTRFFDSLGPEWAVHAVASVVVLVLAYLLGRAIVSVFGRRIARRFRRPSITRTFIRGIRATVFLFALLVVLDVYGYELGNLVLPVAAFTAVLGVVLAPIVGSFIGGVFLLADQPYEIGDMIELADAGQRGFVEDITLRYTKIFTLDNTFLVVPNGTMRERDVFNYSAEDPRTRLRLSITVTYESDVAEARRRVEEAARDVDVVIEGGPDIRVGAARYPAAPICYIDEFADHGIKLTLRYWIEEPYKLLAARSRVQTSTWEAFADADVEIAYPHSHLYFDETSGELQVEMSDTGDGPFDHGVDVAESGDSDLPGDAPDR